MARKRSDRARLFMVSNDHLWWNGHKWGTSEEFKGQSYSTHRFFRTMDQMRRAMRTHPGDWVAVASYKRNGYWIQKTWTPRKAN